MNHLRARQKALLLLKPSFKKTNFSHCLTHLNQEKKKKVIVIGGGFSGLSVAYHLKDSVHYDVQVLEARDRFGGRVHPYNLDGTMVDLGGQWVHETSERNPIRILMEDLQLAFVDRTPRSNDHNDITHHAFGKDGVRHVFDSDGQLIDPQTRQDAEHFFHSTLEQEDMSPRGNVVNMGTSVQNMLDRGLQLLQQNSHQNVHATDKFMQMCSYLGQWSECYEGGRLRELSAALYREGLYQNLGGIDQVPKGTYHALIQALLSKIGNETNQDKLRLGCVVTSIEYDSSSSSSPTCLLPDGKVTIVLDSGERIKGDYCVCTAPLGVLQKRKIAFSPELPEKRWRSIDAIGMGLLDKIALKFDQRFWEYDSFASTHTDPSRVKIFYDCSHDVGAPVLFMYYAGDAAHRVDSPNGLSDEEAVAEAMVALRSIFGEKVTNPVASMVTRWNTDPFACGAYSFAKVGSSAQDYQEVALPVGNLLFAGEHTSLHAHSCVHGAWATGQREAKRLEERVIRANHIALK